MLLKRRIIPVITVVCLLTGYFAGFSSYAADTGTQPDTLSKKASSTVNVLPAITDSSAATPAPVETPETTPAPSPTPVPTVTPSPTPVPTPVNDESLWYREKIPMKKEHQKLLWDYSKLRGLDYIDMLALISTESNFNEKSSTGRYKGYFQISTGNAANLAKTLKTPNTPLDGAVNINWGTAMFSWIMQDKRVVNLESAKKRDVALSIYNRGTGGYDKYGLSTKFLNVYYKKRALVAAYFTKTN